MLFLVGLGLGTKDLSVRAVEEIKKADRLLLETYTAFIQDDYLAFLEAQAGRKPEQVDRAGLEERVRETVALARDSKVVILVPGDPLIATTHSIILNEANTQGVRCEVIHAPSVFSTAIGESGLDVYKFGPTVTIPFWSEKYRPASFIDSLERNSQNGQHTLVLLDINQTERRPMRIREVYEIIKNAQLAQKKEPISADKKIIIMANLGRVDKTIVYSKFNDITKEQDRFEGKQLSLIVPGELSFSEQESVKQVTSST